MTNIGSDCLTIRGRVPNWRPFCMSPQLKANLRSIKSACEVIYASELLARLWATRPGDPGSSPQGLSAIRAESQPPIAPIQKARWSRSSLVRSNHRSLSRGWRTKWRHHLLGMERLSQRFRQSLHLTAVLCIGHSSLVTSKFSSPGHSSLVTGHWSLVTGHLSLVTRHLSLYSFLPPSSF